MSEEQIRYRAFRPELPLAAWVREQLRPVFVHKHDLERLQHDGIPNVMRLEHGGPQPGEVWLEVHA